MKSYENKALFNSEYIIYAFGGEDLVIKEKEVYSKFPKSFGEHLIIYNIHIYCKINYYYYCLFI